MKQTAVEWLVEQVNTSNLGLTSAGQALLVEQAKAMEKEQIKDAWLNSLTKGDYNSAEEYYNEHFKSK